MTNTPIFPLHNIDLIPAILEQGLLQKRSFPLCEYVQSGGKELRHQIPPPQMSLCLFPLSTNDLKMMLSLGITL